MSRDSTINRGEIFSVLIRFVIIEVLNVATATNMDLADDAGEDRVLPPLHCDALHVLGKARFHPPHILGNARFHSGADRQDERGDKDGDQRGGCAGQTAQHLVCCNICKATIHFS